ncbi:MAG: hypothetical protein ACI4M6_02340 [Christensenellaceae bacterium]
MNVNGNLLSPQMLWKDFNTAIPSNPTYLSADIYEGIETKSLYFSGRTVNKEKVRIFGVFACRKTVAKNKSKGALLILPDCTNTVNYELVQEYAKLGYSVFMIDYRGAYPETTNFTEYPKEIEYANYLNRGRRLDYADETAKETCWYEWVACARLAISFLQEQPNVEKIGILGIKEGANIAFMTAGCDKRVDCIVPLFGSGWRAYKGVLRSSGLDIDIDEERMRFLAGVEVQAYAPNVACPVFYMTSTNSPDFDFDRSADTLVRIGENALKDKSSKGNGGKFEKICYVNYAPRLKNYLDEYCKKDVELFLAKYLKDDDVYFPSDPKLELTLVPVKDKLESGVDEENALTVGYEIRCDVKAEFNDKARFKSVSVFISEGIENYAFRDWNEMTPIKSRIESERKFFYVLNGNSSFVNVFVRVEYRNGVTLCTLPVMKKIDLMNKRGNKLLYSTESGLSSFTISEPKQNLELGLFVRTNNMLEIAEDAGVKGLTSRYGLVTYKANKTFLSLNELSIFMTDVYAREFTNVRFTLITAQPNGATCEHSAVCSVSGAEVWQNVLLKCTDFKSEYGKSVKDFSLVSALKIEFDGNVLFNNILFI